ncbi:PcfJ domain-containing protein [Photobacterium leiognathi]|uniref:PcfJ domain-containing protein n=1 Tax=Photobacterium leiognathi TaxID=553611 RepID=UPI002981EBA4|nr:PcfJ domain-containing protein [Photobacterium leiognathi]
MINPLHSAIEASGHTQYLQNLLKMLTPQIIPVVGENGLTINLFFEPNSISFDRGMFTVIGSYGALQETTEGYLSYKSFIREGITIDSVAGYHDYHSKLMDYYNYDGLLRYGAETPVVKFLASDGVLHTTFDHGTRSKHQTLSIDESILNADLSEGEIKYVHALIKNKEGNELVLSERNAMQKLIIAVLDDYYAKYQSSGVDPVYSTSINNWILAPQNTEASVNRSKFLAALKDDIESIALKLSNIDISTYSTNNINCSLSSLVSLFDGFGPKPLSDVDSQFECDVDRGLLIGHRARVKYVSEKFNLSKFNRTIYDKTIVNFLATPKNVKESLGLAMLNIDLLDEKFACLVRPTTSREKLPDFLTFLTQGGSQVLAMEMAGEEKAAIKKYKAKYDFLLAGSSDSDVIQRYKNWSYKDDFDNARDYYALVDDLVMAVTATLITASGVDGFESVRESLVSFEGHIHLDYSSLICELSEMADDQGWSLYSTAFNDVLAYFSARELLIDRGVTIKDIAVASSLAHKVYMPRFDRLKQSYLVASDLRKHDHEWEPLFTNAYRLTDEFTVVPLHSQFQLNDEGERMKHCVGSYYSRAACGQSYILSVKDCDGLSIATVELAIERGQLGEVESVDVIQVYGKGNTTDIPGSIVPGINRMVAEIRSGKLPVSLIDPHEIVPVNDLDVYVERQLRHFLPVDDLRGVEDALRFLSELSPDGLDFTNILAESGVFKFLHEKALANSKRPARLLASASEPCDDRMIVRN